MGGDKTAINAAVVLALLGLSLFAHADQKPLSGLNLDEFDQKAKTSTNWGNNPFVVPLNDVAISELKLTGIVYSDTNKGAIIGNQLVVIGDKIGSNEVVAIERSRVILRNENGLYSLAISGGDK
jgi:hypothetical protein